MNFVQIVPTLKIIVSDHMIISQSDNTHSPSPDKIINHMMVIKKKKTVWVFY